jgi:hypothetical protein
MTSTFKHIRKLQSGNGTLAYHETVGNEIIVTLYDLKQDRMVEVDRFEHNGSVDDRRAAITMAKGCIDSLIER